MRRLTFARALATSTLATCALAGCDAGDHAADGDDATAAPTATCALLSHPALEQALGFAVVTTDNSTGKCVVTAADGSPGAPAVDFRVEPRTSAFDHVSAREDAAPVPGLGERAVWATVSEMTGSLVVVTGGRAIVVAITQADGMDAHARRHAEAVARLLLDAVGSQRSGADR